MTNIMMLNINKIPLRKMNIFNIMATYGEAKWTGRLSMTS